MKRLEDIVKNEMLKARGRYLQERRKKLHLTQIDIAKYLNVSRETISAVEQGRRNNYVLISLIDIKLKELEEYEEKNRKGLFTTNN